MDVLYHGKDFTANPKADRLGRLPINRDRLEVLQAGYPSSIWVFKTPKGKRGKLQLQARLVWSDHAKATYPPTSDSYVYYDPHHARSVLFDEQDGAAAVEAVSDWALRHFPAAVRANFNGAHGQQEMRGHVLQELERIAVRLGTTPFMGDTAAQE